MKRRVLWFLVKGLAECLECLARAAASAAAAVVLFLKLSGADTKTPELLFAVCGVLPEAFGHE